MAGQSPEEARLLDDAKDAQDRYGDEIQTLQKLDQNRLTASSFLGGLSFTAFVALASASLPQSSFLGLLLQPAVSWLVMLLLAVSTFLFLVAAYGAYESIRLTSHVSLPKMTSAFARKGRPKRASLAGMKAALLRTAEEKDPVRRAWQVHDDTAGFITAGFVFLLFALFLVALSVSPWVLFPFVIVILLLSRRLAGLIGEQWGQAR